MLNFIVIIFLIAIIVSLGSALFAFVRGGSTDKKAAMSDKMFKSFVWRISLSLALFLLLLLGFSLGLITPSNPNF